MSNQTKQTRLLYFYNPLNCFNASDDSAAVARWRASLMTSLMTKKFNHQSTR